MVHQRHQKQTHSGRNAPHVTGAGRCRGTGVDVIDVMVGVRLDMCCLIPTLVPSVSDEALFPVEGHANQVRSKKGGQYIFTLIRVTSGAYRL